MKLKNALKRRTRGAGSGGGGVWIPAQSLASWKSGREEARDGDVGRGGGGRLFVSRSSYPWTRGRLNF